MKPNYHWWPISFGWDSDPMAQTLYQWAKRAIESRNWTMDYPHRFRCLSTLEVHKAACLRMWHGWPIGNSWTEYGRTLHLGRFKVYFGKKTSELLKVVPPTPKASICRWCAEGEPEWSCDAKAWIHRRDRLDKRCEAVTEDERDQLVAAEIKAGRCPKGHKVQALVTSAYDGRALFACSRCDSRWTEGIRGKALKKREKKGQSI
jgi:hypothetical protein